MEESRHTSVRFEEVKQSIFTIKSLKVIHNEFSILEDVKVTVECSDPGGKSMSYMVRTSPIGWEVVRTLEDFTWLRNTLSSIFSGSVVPPPPPKRLRHSNDPYNLLKQQYFLQRMLDTITSNKLLRTSLYVLSFLKEKDVATFNQAKKEGSKHKKTSRLEELWSLDGYLTCDPIENKEFDKEIKEFLTSTETLRKKVKRQTDSLILKINDVSKDLLEIANTFMLLESIQFRHPETPAYTAMYCSLRNTFEQWAKIEKDKSSSIQLYINNFYKYAYQEIGVLKELQKEKDAKFQAYLKSESKLNAKKEKLWLMGNFSSLEVPVESNDRETIFPLLLPGETKQNNDLRTEFSYCNYQLHTEVKQLFVDNQAVENEHFRILAQSFVQHLALSQSIWSNLERTMLQIKEDY